MSHAIVGARVLVIRALRCDAQRRTIETQDVQIGAEMTVMRRRLETAFDQLETVALQADCKA